MGKINGLINGSWTMFTPTPESDVRKSGILLV